MDRCYRYVWSNGNGQPFGQMSERRKYMTDVRARLGIRSVEWKIEKKVLERLGHVMRMENGILTKAMVLGFYGKLEGKRKTVLY